MGNASYVRAGANKPGPSRDFFYYYLLHLSKANNFNSLLADMKYLFIKG